MSPPTSPTQVLAEVLLDRPLVEYVAEKRNATPRWPWRLIAEQLTTDTDGKVSVSGEWLRSSFDAAAAERAEAAS